MTRYIIKRLLLVIPIVLGVTVIVFCIINAIPGNPGRRMLGPMASQAQVDLLNEQLGYTLPFFQRLWNYLVDVVTFNFGTSYQDGTLKVRWEVYDTLKALAVSEVWIMKKE